MEAMPSSTFLNLPPGKQEKLMEAATREFLERPFNDASINRIVKDAGIPRGSFYMYFRDKEELFRYLLGGYIDQLTAVIEELLLRCGGDIFTALLELHDYMRRHDTARDLGDLGVLCGFIRRNSGLQKSGVLEMIDPERILHRLEDAVNPDLLELRSPRDLRDMISILLATALPVTYNSLQDGDPDARAYLENALHILRRGMGKPAAHHEKEN